MRFCLYTSTPGLERFPQSERFRVWRATHKRLMQEDQGYRRDVRRYRSRVIWLNVLFTILTLLLASSTVLAATGGRTAILFNVAGLGVLSVGYTIYIVVTAFQTQEFMNDSVGKALP